MAAMLPQRESMASVDTAWLHMDRPDNLMSILGVLSFARRIPLARVRRMIEERFLVHPRFRMRPVDAPLGAYWERDAHFDLNRHVREVRLPRTAGPGELQRYLGSLAKARTFARRPADIDLKGAAAYPGLVDAHAHLMGIGFRELTLNLEGSASIVDVQGRVKDWNQAHPGSDPLSGRGWIETHWPEHRFPTRQDLDADPVGIAMGPPVEGEETLGGAAVSAFGLAPDLAIAIDVTFASGPGQPEHKTFSLGDGPTCGWGPNLHPKLHRLIMDTAARAEIPCRLEVMAGHSGTDAYAIQVSREGVPTAVVGLPLKHMHTPVEVVSIKDITRAGRLLAEVIAGLNDETLEALALD